MPVPNELTPEEEAEFVNHGIQPAGPGKEPIVENAGDVQQQGGEGQQQAQEPAAGEGEQRQQQFARPRRADGTFMSAEEIAAQQQEGGQGQQQEGEQGQQQQPKMVPHEALHAERMRVAAATRQAQVAVARMNALLAAQARQQPTTEQLPDLNEDPVGYIRGLEQRLAKFEEERQNDRQTRELDNMLEQDEELFKMQVPDYDAASDHYVESRARELLAFYPPEQAKEIMLQEARQIANAAWQRGMSAGQIIYGLAQARGYNPQQAQQQGSGHQGQQGQRQQQRGPSPQEIVRGVARGQQASRSLSGGGANGQGAVALNAEALLNMSEEEFEEYLQLGKKGADARFAAVG